jgi:hypothetical protein
MRYGYPAHYIPLDIQSTISQHPLDKQEKWQYQSGEPIPPLSSSIQNLAIPNMPTITHKIYSVNRKYVGQKLMLIFTKICCGARSTRQNPEAPQAVLAARP